MFAVGLRCVECRLETDLGGHFFGCRECGGAGRLEAHHEPPLERGGDPFALAGIVTLCRACHIERHRPDDMTPGRADWREFVANIAEGA